MTLHSLHGLVTLELENEPPGFATALRQLVGPPSIGGRGEPDIRITFVENLPPSDELRYVGQNDAAFDGGDFYLLDSSGRRTRVDFERLGEPLELVCEHGVESPPLLLHLIALRLLRKGCVLLHASGFVHHEKGILATGWQRGGKTELLLAFMAEGAQFMSDEWTILSAEDGLLRGVPTIAGIWDWHFRYLPRYWSRLRPADRQRLRLLRAYRRLYRLLPSGGRQRAGGHRAGPVSGILHQLSLETGLAQLGQVRPPAERLFQDQIWSGPVGLDRLFLMTVGQKMAVQPADPTDIARRMVASLSFERRPLVAAYEKFRFAFPDRRSAALETAAEAELSLLQAALEGRQAYELVHPYPVALGRLYDLAAPLCA